MPNEKRTSVHSALLGSAALLAMTTHPGGALPARGGQAPPSPAGVKSARPEQKIAPPVNDSARPVLNIDRDYNADEQTGVTTGHTFTYTVQDRKITGDNVRYEQHQNGKKVIKDLLDADGNLVFEDTKHHATCDRAHVDRVTRLAVFTGSVVLVLKPEPEAAGAPDGGNDRGSDLKKFGVVVHCDRMEDQYNKDYIKLFGHLVFTQHIIKKDGQSLDRTMTAEHAEYDGKAEKMVLFGPVDGHDSDGRTWQSKNNINIGTKAGAETMSGNDLHIKFIPKDVEESSEADNDKADGAKTAATAQPADVAKTTDKKTGIGKQP